MFKVKAQNGSIFIVHRVFVKVFKTVRRTYFFLMGNDTDILGVFVSIKEAQRAEMNFNKWAMALDNLDLSTYFNVAQDFYSEEEENFNRDEFFKNKKVKYENKTNIITEEVKIVDSAESANMHIKIKQPTAPSENTSQVKNKEDVKEK